MRLELQVKSSWTVTKVGKVKFREGQEPERWRIEGRTVVHASWAGWTWRKKGSDLAYFEGCTFPSVPQPPPPPPPPPPTPPTAVWRVVVGPWEQIRVGFVFLIRVYYGVSREMGQTIDTYSSYWQTYRASPIDDLRVEFLAVSYSADALEKHYRIWWLRLGVWTVAGELDISVPPFNGLALPSGGLDEETLTV